MGNAIRRDWTDAQRKRASERRCRVCGSEPGPDPVRIECAHVISREHDPQEPPPDRQLAIVAQMFGGSHNVNGSEVDRNVVWKWQGEALRWWLDRFDRYVRPVDVVPLCRRFDELKGCHPAYDAGELDLLPYLTPAEQAAAVARAGGIITALRRISGRDAALVAPTPTKGPHAA